MENSTLDTNWTSAANDTTDKFGRRAFIPDLSPVLNKADDYDLFTSSGPGSFNGSFAPTSGLPGIDMAQEAAQRTDTFYGVISATGVLIALSNGIFVVLAIGILRRTTVHGMHKAQYVYIASLAGSDCLVGLVIFAIHLSRETNNMCMCRFKISCAVTSGIASILHTLLVAADRYLYIMHGMFYLREVRRTRVLLATATAWAISVAVGFIPFFVHYEEDQAVKHVMRCFYVEVVAPAYAILLNALYIFVGLIPTTALYVTIVRTSFRQRAAVEASTPTSHLPPGEDNKKHSTFSRRTTPATLLRRPSQLFRTERRAVTSILLLILSFAACWIPHSFATLSYEFGWCDDCGRLAERITTIFFYLGTLNSLANPIIYAWGFKEFRMYVAKLFGCKEQTLLEDSQIQL